MVKKKILFVVLYWGLGHASRSIPIIRQLLEQGHEVIIGSDGGALLLLQKEFPTLKTVELPAYDIQYPFRSMLSNMFLQQKRFYKAIKNEKIEVRRIVKEFKIDEIISDNRFGCYSDLVNKNIFITHQINLLTGFRVLDFLARWVNHFFIKKFDEVWIPDERDEKKSLAGKLSHGNENGLPPLRYIGVQSRMQKEIATRNDSFFEKMPKGSKNIVVVLSGPEPQRTILEDEIIGETSKTYCNYLIVRGLTADEQDIFLSKNVRIIGYLTTESLNAALLEADLIISRSGYSTLMDLYFLDKKALLIPTPGQTEQEYLAKRLKNNNRFSVQYQGKLNFEIELFEKVD